MKKILLIEDDKVMRENTAEILSLANYEVITAPDGKKGSFLAKEIIPDLIICDIMMPELDGYGVLHVLSKDPKTAFIPFIFVTAKAEKSEVRKGMELGADDYLIKPFEETELLKAVEIRLNKSASLKNNFVTNFVGLNQFFEHVGGLEDLQELAKHCALSKYKKKEVIFRQGDSPHYLYFLEKGKIKTFKTHEDGKEYITNIFTEGDFFGHISLFENKSYTDSGLVLEVSEIRKIPKTDFLALLHKNRDVSNKFIKMLSSKVEEQESQLMRLAYDTVRKRVAETLLKFQKDDTAPSNSVGNKIILITREDLGKLVGTSTESVIRCLSEFKEDGFIEISGREIIIIKRLALENIQ